MEKSGCMQLTEAELEFVKLGLVPPLVPLMETWGITNFDELKTLIDSGQYRLVDEN